MVELDEAAAHASLGRRAESSLHGKVRRRVGVVRPALEQRTVPQEAVGQGGSGIDRGTVGYQRRRLGPSCLNGGDRGVVLPIRGNRYHSHKRNEEEDEPDGQHADGNCDNCLGSGLHDLRSRSRGV